jgi:hypothetical protein
LQIRWADIEGKWPPDLSADRYDSPWKQWTDRSATIGRVLQRLYRSGQDETNTEPLSDISKKVQIPVERLVVSHNSFL